MAIIIFGAVILAILLIPGEKKGKKSNGNKSKIIDGITINPKGKARKMNHILMFMNSKRK